MPSIAQQDYRVIEIVSISDPTTKEKAEIRKAVENRIIYDCLIRDTLNNAVGKIVGVDFDQTFVYFFDAFNTEIVGIDYAE